MTSGLPTGIGRRFSRHRRAAIGSIVLAYLLLLGLAAWPRVIRPAVLDPLQRSAEMALRRVRVFAGQPVFLGQDSPDWKIRAWCPIVVAHAATGETRVVFDGSPECVAPSFRWTRNRYTGALQQMLNLSPRGWANTKLGRIHLFFANVADHYCHSERARSDGAVRVSIVSLQILKSYRTGEIRQKATLAYDWSCLSNRPTPEPWPEVALELGRGRP